MNCEPFKVYDIVVRNLRLLNTATPINSIQ